MNPVELPPAEWVTGEDPDGNPCYELWDPANAEYRVVVSRWSYGGARRWSADYLPEGTWWWTMPEPRRAEALVPRSSSVEECLRAGTLRIYGHTAYGEYVWRRLLKAGLPPA